MPGSGTGQDAGKTTTDTGKSATGTTGSKAGHSGMDKSAAGKDKAGAKMTGAMKGQHRMTGEVTKIDSAKGSVTLKTDEGDLDLHFPPSALQGIKEGDRVEVQLAIRPAAGTTSKSSDTMGKSKAAAPAGKAGKAGSTDTSGGSAAKSGDTQQPKTQ
jgi:hypothetical protein